MKIVLSTPPVSESAPWLIGGPPPLNLAYLAGSVKNFDDVQVVVVDPHAEGWEHDTAVSRILALSPDVFGIAMTSLDVMRSSRLLVDIKRARPEVWTLSGGYHATVFDKLLLGEIRALDMILRGEADRSFPELVQHLCNGQDLEGIAGISYRRGPEVVSGEPQYMRDLDSLPFPDRTCFTFDDYLRSWEAYRLPKLPRFTAIISSRGCAHQCTFCSKLTPGSRIPRSRSAENVFEEILQVANEGYKLIAFTDENFSHDVKRLEQLCYMILDHKLDLRFGFQGTLHNLSQPLLDLMHRVGFDAVLVGIESGSDAQLKRFKKAANSQELAEGIERAKKAHMVVLASFIHGSPGETGEDCEETKTFVRNVKPHECHTGELMIYPGSKLWEEFDLSANSLEGTRGRKIHTLPGQLTEEEIAARMWDFRKTFIRSWISFIRIRELIDLFRHNRIVRIGLRKALGVPIVMYRLLFPKWDNK